MFRLNFNHIFRLEVFKLISNTLFQYSVYTIIHYTVTNILCFHILLISFYINIFINTSKVNANTGQK